MGSSNGEMSEWAYERYKRDRERRENTHEARCARFFSNATAVALSHDAGATCPCDARDDVEEDAAPGCRFLPFDELPPDDIERHPMHDVVDALVTAFVILFFLFIFNAFRRYRRDERARAENEAVQLQATFDLEAERRRLEHSGKVFVAVRQPAGDLELAEVLVVEDASSPPSSAAGGRRARRTDPRRRGKTARRRRARRGAPKASPPPERERKTARSIIYVYIYLRTYHAWTTHPRGPSVS